MKKAHFTTVIKLILALMLAVLFSMRDDQVYAKASLRIHMINVGNADSFLVECNGRYALIDGGFASHVGKFKNCRKNSARCRLDKYGTLGKALNGKISNLKRFYSRNLFSFYEHFDNDMTELTGTTDAAKIMDAAPRYIKEFDAAAQDYRTKEAAYESAMEQYEQEMKEWEEAEEPKGPPPEPPVMEPTVLSEKEWQSYLTNQKAIDRIRGKLSSAYSNTPSYLLAFMELQKTDRIIKSEDRNSALYKYYTALGYQYIFEQTDQYLKSANYADKGFNDCLAYLKKRHIKTIDYMIATHAHRDHVGGLIAVLASDTIRVKNVIYNGSSYGTANFRLFEREMLEQKKRGRTKIIVADDNKNNRFTLGGAARFRELGDTGRLPAYTAEPNAKNSDKMNSIVNNQSLVYRVDCKGTSALFTGDAEGIKDANGYSRQRDILKRYKKKLNVDVYKAAHHGINNGVNYAFIKAVSPYFVLLSCGTKGEPNYYAKDALKGADMWVSRGRGQAIIASVSKRSFRVVNAKGKNITRKPSRKHKVICKITSGYTSPAKKRVKVKIKPGWYYTKVQYKVCKKNKKASSTRWRRGRTVYLKKGFEGRVYFRLTNKFGIGSATRKKGGFKLKD